MNEEKILPECCFRNREHRNFKPGDDRERNLIAVCGRCHLELERDHHRQMRQQHKDARRPLLALMF